MKLHLWTRNVCQKSTFFVPTLFEIVFYLWHLWLNQLCCTHTHTHTHKTVTSTPAVWSLSLTFSWCSIYWQVTLWSSVSLWHPHHSADFHLSVAVISGSGAFSFVWFLLLEVEVKISDSKLLTDATVISRHTARLRSLSCLLFSILVQMW